MKRRLLSVLLILTLVVTSVLGLGTLTAYAANSGNCGAGLFTPGKNAKFNYDPASKTLTISGTGATKDYGESVGLYPPWQDYKTEIEKLVIEEGIETVGNYNFFNFTSLKEVSLPSTLKTISGAAAMANSGSFASCTALEKITLPEGLETIGYNAFNGCTALKSIKFPDSLKKLEGSYGLDTVGALGPFTGCTNLETVTYGTGITSTGTAAFVNSGVKYIYLSSTITEISPYCFAETKPVSVELPDSVSKIGIRAFANCTFLDTVTVNNANCDFGNDVANDPFSGSQQSLLMRGHTKSTTQTYAEEKGYAFESIDPCDHEVTTVVIDPEPTCTEEGVSTEYCNNCGFAVSTSKVPAEGHLYKLTETEDASESDGHIYSYYVCDICGAEKTVTEHKNWIEGFYNLNVVNPATCTTSGLQIYSCNIEGCSVLPKSEIIPKGNHQIEEYSVVSQPTCTEKGSKEGLCTVCGEFVTVDIPALGHTDELYETLDNTAEDGHTYEIYKCSVCSTETVVSKHIEWLDGFYNSTVIAKPICTVDGARLDTCTVESCKETRYVTLPKTGEHSWEETSRTEPTCTAAGNIFYSCTNEGCLTKTKTERIPALGHDYIKQDGSSVEPTCTSDGYNDFKCSRCSSTKRDAIPALGHTPGEITILKEASCTQDGKEQSVCTVCGVQYEYVTPMLGHTFEDVNTDIEDKPGHIMSTPTCTRCGQTEPAKVIHNEWLDGYFTTEKRSEGTGCNMTTIITDTCTLCSETRNQIIPASGHSFAYTRTKNDGTLVYICKVCQTEQTRLPAVVQTSFKRQINKQAADVPLNEGAFFDVTCDGIINAKDYAIINKALILAQAH